MALTSYVAVSDLCWARAQQPSSWSRVVAAVDTTAAGRVDHVRREKIQGRGPGANVLVWEGEGLVEVVGGVAV